MASSSVDGVRVAGIACAVPTLSRTAEDEAALLGRDTAARIAASIGIRTRRIAPPSVCTSDLCASAAERLIEKLGWNREEIGGLVVVTQTPDYLLPATSCTLHRRLSLSPSAFAFDVNLGCSGFVYGLWIAGALTRATGLRVLLLVGDTISRISSPADSSVALLFGDAGSATALEPDINAPAMSFQMGSDGNGDRSLIVPAGGFRHPRNAFSGQRTERENGAVRSDEDLFMDGPEVFSFALRRVPPLVQAVLKDAGRGVEDIDAFVFHQANAFMLNHLAKRLRIPNDRLVVGMEDFGNTSSASIPLAIVTSGVGRHLASEPLTLLLAGFGVGFSWAAAVVRWGPEIPAMLVELPNPDASECPGP